MLRTAWRTTAEPMKPAPPVTRFSSRIFRSIMPARRHSNRSAAAISASHGSARPSPTAQRRWLDRPVDAQIRVVPADAAIMLAAVIVRSPCRRSRCPAPRCRSHARTRPARTTGSRPRRSGRGDMLAEGRRPCRRSTATSRTAPRTTRTSLACASAAAGSAARARADAAPRANGCPARIRRRCRPRPTPVGCRSPRRSRARRGTFGHDQPDLGNLQRNDCNRHPPPRPIPATRGLSSHLYQSAGRRRTRSRPAAPARTGTIS